MRIRSWMIAVLATVALSAPAQAAPISFGALLTTGQEIPSPDVPPEFTPFGAAFAEFDTDTDELTVALLWADLTSTPIGAHIHRFTPPSMTGPILIGLGTLPPFTTAGIFLTLSLTPDQSASLLEGLQDGSLYFNVHTERNPPGEIRGNVGKVAVSEPTSLLLLSTGLFAVALIRRRMARRG